MSTSLQLLAKLGLDTSEFASGIKSAQDSLSSLGTSVTRAGKGLSVGLTAPLLFLGQNAVSQFGSFNAEIERAGAFVNASADEMAEFRTAAINAAKGTSFSFEQAAAALGSFVGGEIDAQTATDELGAVIDLALVAKMSDLTEAVNVSSLAFTTFAKDGLEMSDVIDTMATVAANVTTETSAWARALSNSGGAAAAAGMSFTDLNKVFAIMVRGGADVNAIWAAFNSAIVNIQSPSKGTRDALKSVGIQANGLSAALSSQGVIGLLDLLKQGFDTANESGQGFAWLTDVLGRQAAPEFAMALGLTNEEMLETASYFDDMAGSGTEMVDRIRDSISPMDQMKQLVSELSLTIGERLLPYFAQLIDWVEQGVQWFTNLSPSTQNLIVIAGMLAAALGPVLIVLGTVITAIGTLSGFLLPLIIIIALVAAAVAAWNTNFLGVRDTVEAVWSWLKEYLFPVLETLAQWYLTEYIPGAIQILSDFWTGVLQPAIDSVVLWITGSLFPFFERLVEWLSGILPVAIEVLSRLWDSILLPAIQRVWGFLSGSLFPLLGAIASFLGAVLGLAVRVLAGVWENVLLPAVASVWTWFKDKLLPVIEEVAAFLTDLFEPAVLAVGAAFDTVTGFVRGLADAIANIDLPDWLTPGSPTPFEIGLWGIADALRTVNRIGMPEFHAEEAPFRNADIKAFDAMPAPDRISAGLQSTHPVAGQPVDYDRLAESIVMALRPALQARPTR